MLDYLKYFPLSLGVRQNNNYLTPKGPYFKRQHKITWNLNDCRFNFKAPRTNNIFGSERYGQKAKSRSPSSRTNLANIDILNYSPSFMPTQAWNYSRFFLREWFFVGPWFSGEKARLLMFADLVGPTTDNRYKGSSYFHPRVFESVIADWLDARYGHYRNGKQPCFRGPMDWRPIELSSTITGAVFDIHQIDSSKEQPDIFRYILFPVTHDRFVTIHFDYFGSRPKDSFIDTKPIYELSNSILDSFSLEVGTETQKEWANISKVCPDMSLTPTFGELKWPITKSRKKNQETEKEIKPKPINLIEYDNEV